MSGGFKLSPSGEKEGGCYNILRNPYTLQATDDARAWARPSATEGTAVRRGHPDRGTCGRRPPPNLPEGRLPNLTAVPYPSSRGAWPTGWQSPYDRQRAAPSSRSSPRQSKAHRPASAASIWAGYRCRTPSLAGIGIGAGRPSPSCGSERPPSGLPHRNKVSAARAPPACPSKKSACTSGPPAHPNAAPQRETDGPQAIEKDVRRSGNSGWRRSRPSKPPRRGGCRYIVINVITG